MQRCSLWYAVGALHQDGEIVPIDIMATRDCHRSTLKPNKKEIDKNRRTLDHYAIDCSNKHSTRGNKRIQRPPPPPPAASVDSSSAAVQAFGVLPRFSKASNSRLLVLPVVLLDYMVKVWY